MTKITWGNLTSRQYETGLDRGVLYLNGNPAIPWNGLTGVDENGSDAAVGYYIDGRPFLFFPKPKEFSATLRALTFPEQFSSVMGLVEAADGMYLDSQVGDTFGLSYRTRVGSAVSEDLGYKIHLVYNASVALQGTTYETLSDSVNPIEFAWDIQAVPVLIEGYRPTAHIVIDTRHMDKAHIMKIEAMLYGTGNTDGHLPDPSVILDLLSFGDTINIYDNEDGTWTAEGSYANVYLIGDGIFEIKNVDATDNGDGTYTISSTGV